jgi:hypothetical protein
MQNHTTARVFMFPLLFLALLPVPSLILQQQYQPTLGQGGKDVIWMPTPDELVTTMLNMGRVTSDDYVIDLGSGDGRIVIAAAKRGARALGIEYNPDMVGLSRQNAEREGVSDRATFMQADLFETDLSKATAITMYLLPVLNMKLRPKILALAPGTRVVSHAFDMGDWQADRTEEVEGRTAYLWIVPAKVDGVWTWSTASGIAELTLTQNFQKISGTLKVKGLEHPLQQVMLEGDRISFTAGEGNPILQEYSGRVLADRIRGIWKTTGKPDSEWLAVRRSVTAR